MELVRFACISLIRLRPEWRSWVFNDGAVCVETHNASEMGIGIRLLVSARTRLESLPNVDDAGRVVIPANQLDACERLIEQVASLLAISEACRRQIASPSPCVALAPQSPEDEAWLAARPGFAFPTCAELTVWFDHGFNALNHLDALSDRLDGVMLLAEAVSQDHLAGRFRDLIRLFERAFRRSNTALIKPLAAFLQLPILSYTTDEVRHWITQLRHPLTHADERDYFLIEADVRPFVRRVEQAAYDVLLNKLNWRSPDAERRNQWHPDAVVTRNMPVVKQHSTVTMRSQVLDDLCRYGKDLNAGLTSLPANFWIGDYWERVQRA